MWYRFLIAMLASAMVLASEQPYDEQADARADLKQALIRARAQQKPVLIVFGANWCGDCRALDRSLKTDKNARLMAASFEIVKVDVARFNKNLDIDTVYGNPIKQGIPAVVVLAPDQRVLYATRAGELANARKMDDEGVYGFFSRIVEQARQPG
ncbi:thioredoxin family protein [Chitinimonas sp. BJYL2]|uniref:thioredoxin family protein n=1 Tax=Chitinimonas sp. BJYL2 TaxID=2976696 RepID=UPI0022B36305|nr:thioredoxin family protein [Chitinimonas sp. BJYL2]